MGLLVNEGVRRGGEHQTLRVGGKCGAEGAGQGGMVGCAGFGEASQEQRHCRSRKEQVVYSTEDFWGEGAREALQVAYNVCAGLQDPAWLLGHNRQRKEGSFTLFRLPAACEQSIT